MLYKINFKKLKTQRLKNCNCELEQKEENICPCLSFIETGNCKCGLFIKHK